MEIRTKNKIMKEKKLIKQLKSLKNKNESS